MNYIHQGRRFDRDSSIYTPTWLAEWLRDILYPAVKPSVVLDPCVGLGRLVFPWYEYSKVLGVDLEHHVNVYLDKFIQYPFDAFDTWSHDKPDLILCNPPFGQCQRNMMWPEVFLRTITQLFGKDQPTVMFVPHGFRLNLREKSRRRVWMREAGPEITSVVSLPLDVFPSVEFHCEILFFNIPNVKPHYWIDMP